MRKEYSFLSAFTLAIVSLQSQAQLNAQYNDALNYQTEASSIFMTAGYKGRTELHPGEVRKLTSSLTAFQKASTSYAQHLVQTSSSDECISSAEAFIVKAPNISAALEQPASYWFNYIESGAMDDSMDVIDSFNDMATDICMDDLFN